jgi:hypothetical protein
MMPLLGAARTIQGQAYPRRYNATSIEVKKQEETAVDVEQKNRKLGVDMTFNE